MQLATAFDDMPNDLEFDANAPKTEITRESVFREKCRKCDGSGKFIGYSGMNLGPCFACKGFGHKEFRTSPDARLKARQGAARREEQKADARWAAFEVAQPARAAWINANPEFGFAQNMREAVRKYGDLTEGQAGAVDRCVERAKQYAEEKANRELARQQREAAAPAVTSDRLERAFATAQANGLKYPRITLGDIVVKPAGASSRNPGALYVTESGNYLGKVLGGRFLRVAACGAEQEAKVVALVNDPVRAAEAYGIETGVCCICNRELTNKESIARGIGPICGEKFGF